MTEEQKQKYIQMDNITLVEQLLEQQNKVDVIRNMRDSYQDDIEKWQKFHDELYTESKLLIDLKYLVIGRMAGVKYESNTL